MEGPNTGTAPAPYSLVWAPIPVISWIWPMIGHLGISRSDKTIIDFAVVMHEGAMAFGGPARYLPLKPELAVVIKDQANLSAARMGGSAKSLASLWDENIGYSLDVFKRRQYSFLYENCHSFVAHFLNSVRYGDSARWSHVKLVWLMASGHFVDGRGFVRSAVPAALTLGLGWHLLGPTMLIALWLCGLLMLFLWFTVFVNCANPGPRNMLLSV